MTRAGLILRYLALGGLLGFVACLVAEHALAANLSPARHEVSEYVHTETGAVMTVGLGLWAGSLAVSAAIAWRAWHSRVLASLLALGSFGIVLADCFATQTSAGALPPATHLTTTGRLHDIGSGLASLALLTAAIASAARPCAPRWLRIWTAVLAGAAVVGSIVLLAIGPSVGGIRQRLLIASGLLWQLLLLKALERRDRTPFISPTGRKSDPA